LARRAGCLLALVLALSVVGAATILSWLLGGDGPVGHPARMSGPIAVLLILFGLVVFLRARARVWHPLGGLIEAADRVAAGNFSMKVTESGPPFLRSVARAFNDMTARLAVQDEQRRHLMADIAHELRTPLAVLQGRLEGLIDGVYPADERHLAEALDETRVLARLIEDLRVLAETESGTLALNRESTDIPLLAHEVVAGFSSEAEQRGIAMSVVVRGSVPPVSLDPVRVRQILLNLVDNALKHTPSGGTVTINVEPDADDIAIRVRDTGSGISPVVLPHVFDRFWKAPGSGGSGLGLTIVRNLVVAHGGTIAVESNAGTGTVFTVRLPVPSAGD
jgi:signal transduction histidine kinase